MAGFKAASRVEHPAESWVLPVPTAVGALEQETSLLELLWASSGWSDRVGAELKGFESE